MEPKITWARNIPGQQRGSEQSMGGSEERMRSGPSTQEHSTDYALILHGADYEGRTVFPRAREKADAFADWLISGIGGRIPAKNVYRPLERFHGPMQIAIEKEFYRIMDDVVSRIEVSESLPPRLIVYAAGPFLGGASRAPFICGAGTPSDPLCFDLVDACERLLELGIFSEILLFVDGVDLMLSIEQERTKDLFTDRILKTMPGSTLNPGQLFACIVRVPFERIEMTYV